VLKNRFLKAAETLGFSKMPNYLLHTEFEHLSTLKDAKVLKVVITRARARGTAAKSNT
jgi:hypothetical protein